jgi:hypothetical protein
MRLRNLKLTLPQLFFIAATRAALGAGVALLATRRMSYQARRKAGAALALIGAVTTLPAARFAARGNRTLLERATHALR